MNNNAFIYPATSLASRLITRAVNCPLLLNMRRLIFSRLPFMQLHSDVENVVYCTWVVDTEAVAHLVPPGVSLVQRDGKTLFTILTYAHRHFGPRVAGPIRRLFPSPLQSNWRLYVEHFEGDVERRPTVLFVKNVFNDPRYAIGSRLFSDALPSHLAAHFEHTVRDKRYRTRLTGGAGSGPDFSCDAVLADERLVPEALLRFFNTWESALTSICLQDGALAHVADCELLAHARIELPIAIETVQPLTATVPVSASPFLAKIGITEPPFAFAVPRVQFSVLSERLIVPGRPAACVI